MINSTGLVKRQQNLDQQIEALAAKSTEATLLGSIPGFGKTSCAEIAGEVGTVKRFSSEASLALYLGMATLDNSSGNYRGSKAPKHIIRVQRWP
jgi:transposase